MKFLFLALMILSPLKGFAQEAAPAPETSRCVRNLVTGQYADQDRAEQLCEQFSTAVLGCAMDMIDMKMESDLFEAIEYCADPIVRR
jgi:hypothetical protein